jgi:uncharacterized protein DUF5670
MLRVLGILFLLLWLVGVLAFKTIGAVIHIALVVGVILLLAGLFRGRRTA